MIPKKEGVFFQHNKNVYINAYSRKGLRLFRSCESWV